MRIRQGAFSYLADLTDEEIAAQIRYGLDRGWAVVVEHTDDPHPRNGYWHLWGSPMFGLTDPALALEEIRRCRAAVPDHYVRVGLHDPSPGRMTTALRFMVHRPEGEPGFRLDRREIGGRVVRYALHAYAADRPHGARYPATERRSRG